MSTIGQVFSVINMRILRYLIVYRKMNHHKRFFVSELYKKKNNNIVMDEEIFLKCGSLLEVFFF